MNGIKFYIIILIKTSQIIPKLKEMQLVGSLEI